MIAVASLPVYLTWNHVLVHAIPRAGLEPVLLGALGISSCLALIGSGRGRGRETGVSDYVLSRDNVSSSYPGSERKSVAIGAHAKANDGEFVVATHVGMVGIQWDGRVDTFRADDYFAKGSAGWPTLAQEAANTLCRELWAALVDSRTRGEVLVALFDRVPEHARAEAFRVLLETAKEAKSS